MSDQGVVALVRAQSSEACHVPGRSMAICNYCLNRNTYECESECQSEGKYRYLEPESLPQWEMPPQLPPFRAVVNMPWADTLATIWLHAYYLEPS